MTESDSSPLPPSLDEKTAYVFNKILRLAAVMDKLNDGAEKFRIKAMTRALLEDPVNNTPDSLNRYIDQFYSNLAIVLWAAQHQPVPSDLIATNDLDLMATIVKQSPAWKKLQATLKKEEPNGL